MCFSLEMFKNFAVTCIILGTVIVILAALVRFVAPKIGIGGEVLAFIAQILTYIMWAFILIAVVVFVFGLVGCLLSSGGLHLFPVR